MDYIFKTVLLPIEGPAIISKLSINEPSAVKSIILRTDEKFFWYSHEKNGVLYYREKHKMMDKSTLKLIS